LIIARNWLQGIIDRYQESIAEAQDAIKQIQKHKATFIPSAQEDSLPKTLTDMYARLGYDFKRGNKGVGWYAPKISDIQAKVDKWIERRDITKGVLSGDDGVLTKLADVQGIVEPAELTYQRGIDLAGTVGPFGGKIADVQAAIKGLGEDLESTGGADTSELAALQLQQSVEALQRLQVERMQLPVLSQIPQMIASATGNTPFLGGFATGGRPLRSGVMLVGEHEPELVKTGASSRVETAKPSSGSSPDVRVVVNGHIVPLEDLVGPVVEVYVDGKLREDASFDRRRS
jgi:hypothetical protein